MTIRYVLIVLATISVPARLHGQAVKAGVGKSYVFLPKTKNSFEFVYENDFLKKRSVYAQAGFGYKWFNGVGVSADYRYELKQFYEGKTLERESRITADLSLKRKTANDYAIKNRLRSQFEMDGFDAKKFYVRNRLVVSYDFTKNSEPYFFVEPYYSVAKKKVDAIKISVGEEFELFNQDFDLGFIIDAEIKDAKILLSYVYSFIWSL